MNRIMYNVTNHPQEKWSAEQLKAAHELADQIIYMPFLNVSPSAEERTIRAWGADIAGTIVGAKKRGNDVIALVQGEMTLTYAIVQNLIAHGIKVVAATSDRISVDNGDGTKTVKFEFCKFREYTEIKQWFYTDADPEENQP